MFKRLTVKFFIVFFTVNLLLLTFSSFAYAKDPSPCTLDPTNQKYIDYVAKYGPCPAGLDEIAELVGNIISMVVGLSFIAMLVLLIWAGIKYLTSGGEPKAVQTAHQIVTWALLGILFMAIAWLILQLVAGFTGINNLTIFNIKTLCVDPKDPTNWFCNR